MRSAACAFLAVLVSVSGPVFAQTPSSPDADLPVFRALERVALDASAPKTDRLSAIGSLAAAHPSVAAALLTLLGDPDPELRSASAVALGWAGNKAATGSLLQRAEDAAESASVRISAIRSLARIGDPAAVPAAERLARDSGAPIRREALLALTESALSSHADRVSAAIALLDDVEQDGHARSRAAVLLGAAKDPRAVEPLIRVLQDPRQPAGFSALPSPDGLTGQAKIMAQRLRSLHTVRAHAAMILGLLQDQRARSVLLTSLSDADPLVRMQSAGALGRLRVSDAVAGLIEVLDDSDSRVRQVAGGALGALCDPAAGPALQRAMHDQEGDVRARVASALGRLGHAAARPDLVKLAEEDPVPRVREHARAALRRLDSGKVCQ